MLRVSQLLPTDIFREAPTTNFMFYNEIDGIVNYYATAYDYYNEATTVEHPLLKDYLTYNTSKFDIVDLFSFSNDLHHSGAYADIDASGVVYADTITRIEKQYELNLSQGDFSNELTNNFIHFGTSLGIGEDINNTFKTAVQSINVVEGNTLYEIHVDKYMDQIVKEIIDKFTNV